MVDNLLAPVRGLEGKTITQIACGQQHTVALDSDGLSAPVVPLVYSN
jgi:alpha-tubulin suppressor-like RCC1 family protein